MTREEAIKNIKVLLLKIEPPTDTQLGWLETWVHEEDVEALRMAIKALEQEPTEFEEIDFVQEHKKIPVTLDLTSCDDAISRQAVLDIFGYAMDYWKEHAIDVEPHEIKDALIEQYKFTAEQLSELLPVTPQKKTAYWIDDNGGHGTSCSNCGKWYSHPYLTKKDIIYCCGCGAKMESEGKK